MKNRTIIYGENLYDVCISVYGNLEALKDLMADNPVLTSWSMDISPLAGQDLIYDETKYNVLPSQVQAAAKIQTTVKNIIGQSRQSVFDILMLTYGSFDNFIKLVTDSGYENLNDFDANNRSFSFDTQLTQNQELYNYLNKLAPAKPATLYDEKARAVWDGAVVIWDGAYILTWD